jgi:hypothetical protein
MEAKRQIVSAWIDRKIRSYMDQSGCRDYTQAYRKILGDDPELRQMYADVDTKTTRGPAIKASAAKSGKPVNAVGLRLHRLITDYMTDHGVESYHQAMQAVLSERPDIAREYAQS